MIRRIVTVKDKMQQGYCYELSAPIGRDFDPEFRPDLTPKAMLELGVFCGKYLTDCRDEHPASWFARAKLSASRKNCSLNYFGVNASQTLSEWQRKGWIHPDDPRGWFQWYCRYYAGRRMPEEDKRQIRRWKAMKRHVAQIRMHCETGRSVLPTATAPSPVALGLRQQNHLTAGPPSSGRCKPHPSGGHNPVRSAGLTCSCGCPRACISVRPLATLKSELESSSAPLL